MKSQIRSSIPAIMIPFILLMVSAAKAHATTIEIAIVTKFPSGWKAGSTVILFENNAVVGVLMQPDSKMRYVFSLKENTSYTIVIFHRGYHNRKLSINTSIPKECSHGKIYYFTAIVQMISENVKMDADYSDHPVAFVEYMPGRDVFGIRVKYTSNYKKIVKMKRKS